MFKGNMKLIPFSICFTLF